MIEALRLVTIKVESVSDSISVIDVSEYNVMCMYYIDDLLGDNNYGKLLHIRPRCSFNSQL